MTRLDDPNFVAQFERLPPHDLEAEQCVIASGVLDATMLANMRTVVSRADFYQADHQIIFTTLCEMADHGIPFDVVTLRAELQKRGLLEEVGGLNTLVTILNRLPSGAHGLHYAQIVKQLSIWRMLISIGNDCLREGYNHATESTAQDVVVETITKLSRILSDSNAMEIDRLGEIVTATALDLERVESGSLIQTGFKDLDAEIGGIGPGEMLLIGARPSQGKSTLLRDISRRTAKIGTHVGFISLEEPKMKIGRNTLAAEGNIINAKLRRKDLDADDWTKIGHSVNKLAGLPVWVATRARNINAIRAVASQMVTAHGVQVLMIDYLQRIQAPGKTRYEQVTNSSLAISDMIKELNVAGVIAAQLSRDVLGRDDKRPTMGDLRESGQIEQDADGIIFLHREDYYHLDDSNYEPNHEAELIIAKMRDAERGGAVKLRSNLKHQRFDDLEPEIPFGDGQ